MVLLNDVGYSVITNTRPYHSVHYAIAVRLVYGVFRLKPPILPVRRRNPPGSGFVLPLYPRIHYVGMLHGIVCTKASEVHMAMINEKKPDAATL
jgi:hypothetical protein